MEQLTRTGKLIIMTSFLFISTSFAQDNRGAPPERPTFASLDLNEDGEITFEEFSDHEIPHGDHETAFNHIDADQDSLITEEEFNNHKPPRRPRREEE